MITYFQQFNFLSKQFSSSNSQFGVFFSPSTEDFPPTPYRTFSWGFREKMVQYYWTRDLCLITAFQGHRTMGQEQWCSYTRKVNYSSEARGNDQGFRWMILQKECGLNGDYNGLGMRVGYNFSSVNCYCWEELSSMAVHSWSVEHCQ